MRLRMAGADPANQVLPRQSCRGELPIGRPNMFRKSLYALAAALMTVGTFSSTVGIMTVDSNNAAQIV